MTKKLIVIALCLLAFNGAQAQKYLSRTGKVTFYSGASLEKIEAFNNEVATILDAKSGDVIFQAPVKSFKFEKELMQEHFNEDYMESDKYPKSEFKGKITNISEVNFSKDGTYNVKVSGNLTMHGVTKAIQVTGEVVVKGKSVTLKSKFIIKEADYNIKVPSVMSEKIAPQLEITVNAELAPM